MGLIGICAAALVGLAAGDLVRLDASRLVAAATAALIGAALGWRKPAWRLVALVTCAAALGAARASTAAGDGLGALAFVGGLSSSAPAGRPMGPPSMASSVASLIADARGAIDSGVRRYLPEPQASLALGVLLGGSGHLDAAMRVDLQRSGLAHLVAIDGLKQVLVAATLGKLSARLIGPFFGALPMLVGIAAYTLLTGGHPSAVRAGLMVGLATLGSLAGRVSDPLTGLLVAVVLMAAVQPRALLDLGLQLSFSATLGIVLLWPRLGRRLRRVPRWIAEPVGLTLAVSLATLPLMVSTFQVVSLVSPLAHVVALPLLSAVLVTTALLAAASPLAPLGVILGWLAWLPTTLLVVVIRFFGGWPAAAVSTGRPPPLASLCLAAGLLAWGLWGLPELQAARLALMRRRGSNRGWSLPPVSGVASPAAVRRWGAPAACIGALLAARGVLAVVGPDGQLHVHRLALARGEAVFIRGPTGRTVLLVRGPAEAPSLVREVAGHLALWEHKLDAAVQLDAGSGTALALTLNRYPADRRLVLIPQEQRQVGAGAESRAQRQVTQGANDDHPRVGSGERADDQRTVEGGGANEDERQVHLAGPNEDDAEVDLGGGAVLEVSRPDGRVWLRYARPTSDPTTSGARPGSAD